MGETIQLTSARDGFGYNAYRAPVSDARRGGLVILHAIWGVTPHLRELADSYAEAGYEVIIPSLFDRVQPGFLDYNVDSALLDRQMAHGKASGWGQELLDAVQAAIDALKPPVFAMGFCFGGGTALRYAVETPSIKATAIFYGAVISDPAVLKSLNGPVLGIFGANDTMIPVSEPAALEAGLTAAGIPNEITVYPGEGHAFVTSVAEIRKGGNQGKAWQQLRSFLAASFSAQGYTRIQTVGMRQQVDSPRSWTVNRLVHLFVCNQTTNQSAFQR